MTLILLEGFDDGLRDQRWFVDSLPAVASSAFNRLGNSQMIADRFDKLAYNLQASEQHATLTIGLWMRATDIDPASVTAANSFFQFRSDAAATIHIGISMTTTRQLVIKRGDDTVLGTTDIVWPSTTSPRYIEIKVVLHDTAGSVQIWQDGVSIINLTSIDTKNGGTAAVFDQMRIYGGNASSSDQNAEIDDIYITNGAGDPPYNANLGDIVVDTLFPDGNGNYSAFDGSDGNSVDNYLLVNENPYDGDTTYVESGTDTERDSYTFDDLVSASGDIKGLIATAVVRNTGAADNLQLMTRISTTDYDGSTQVAPAGFDASVKEVWQVSPASTNDWTVSEVNAAEFGIENVT